MTGKACLHQGTALSLGFEDINTTILTAGAPGQGQVRNPETVL